MVGAKQRNLFHKLASIQILAAGVIVVMVHDELSGWRLEYYWALTLSRERGDRK